ncbi:MAG: Asp-tRNA(Asn)/Glu-tRNA(Gln) amidotransferase subunit GatC [Planctomycetes bacterium]|nr:Asp-tRNA(Asn)/Glu-tRNA(Gln) amidotransferase subunit GatC [Planctomycetota bacterium]
MNNTDKAAQAVDTDMVRDIAALSRIKLDDSQLEPLSRQFAGILGYFDKLQQLDTENVEPMAHAVEIHNVLAGDVPSPSLSAEEALANAPQRSGDFFTVPRVIGES